VLHFRGDFEEAAAEWLRGVATGTHEAGALMSSAALATTYGGDLEQARSMLDEARELMAPIGSLSHHAYRAYVEGEWRAPTSIEDAMPFYREAIDLASRAGTSFVEGVARVSLVAAQRRRGDIAGAATGYGELLRMWRRSGHVTQLWTTARNAAELLAATGREETAALLLICAEEAPGAAAVGPEIARFSARAFVRVSDLAGPEQLDRLRAEASSLGAPGVLDRAEGELREVAVDG
jgi:hypothetical protein